MIDNVLLGELLNIIFIFFIALPTDNFMFI